MSNGKILKKGDFLFKEFDKVPVIYIVQTGLLSLTTYKNKKAVEITTVGPGYVFADNIILGVPHYTYSALAIAECKVVELPIEIFKEQFDVFHTVFRSFMKTQSDKLKWAFNEIRNKKSDRESLACSHDELLKVFGSVLTTIKTRGVADKDSILLDWTLLKTQNQRLFHEPARRTEQAVAIFSKLGFVEYIKQDPEDGNVVRLKTEIESIRFKNMAHAESILDFFQYAYYKSGSHDLIRLDENSFTLLHALVVCFADQKVDHLGIVSMDYDLAAERLADYGIRLGQTTFQGLESRGLVCRFKTLEPAKGQKASDVKPLVQFDRAEFEVALDCWKILKEVEKWNEKGIVDEQPPITLKKKALVAEKMKCGSCGFELMSTSKFCSECGNKMLASTEFSEVSNSSNITKKSA